MMSVSPGHIVGNMLLPVTWSRSAPDDRNTSAASSHLAASRSSKIIDGFTKPLD